MRILGFSRHALLSCATAALVAGCGGSQPPIGMPGAMSQTSAVSNRHLSSKSGGGDLMYISGEGGHSYILSYPQGKLVQTIGQTALGACADAAGNVFMPGGIAVTGQMLSAKRLNSRLITPSARPKRPRPRHTDCRPSLRFSGQ